MSVAGCPEVWCGVSVNLTRHKEKVHCDRAVISQGQKRSNNYEATIARTAGSRGAWLGRGDRDWATTELRLTTVPSQVRPQVNSSGNSG